MSFDLPSKRIQQNFASHIEMRENKLSISMDPFKVVFGLTLYFLNKMAFRFSKRKLKVFALKVKKPLKKINLGILIIIMLLGILGLMPKNEVKEATTKAPRLSQDESISSKGIIASPKPEVIGLSATRSAQVGLQKSFSGYISHYSRAGCIGCSKNFTMANGEPLDDNAFTIAVPPGWLPMNTIVRVTNLDNGKSVIAKVTDTGGFLKYGRIADLTLAVGKALETKDGPIESRGGYK